MALNDGLVNLGPVVNTYAGHFESDGGAYTLELPFEADKIEWWNYTKYGTNSENLSGVWFKDFPAGDALIVARGTTDLTSTLETTNGVTDASTSGGFTDQHLTITGISAATPGVVTSAAHGLSSGDRGVITKVVGSMGDSVNNRQFQVTVLTANTFSLQDINGNDFTTSGTYTSGGQWTKAGPRLGIVDVAPRYLYTLGSAVMGNDSDEIYFVAYKFQNYVDLGDIV